MQHPPSFDPDVYFNIVADHLMRNLGLKALVYADIALQKMKDMGDREGLDLWIGVHTHLSRKAHDHPSASDHTVH